MTNPRDVARDPAAVVAAVCAALFVLLALIVNGHGHTFLDEPVTSFVRGLPVPPDAWAFLTFLGGTILLPIGIVLVVGLALARRWREAVVVGVALLLAVGLTEAVKLAVARPRPPGGALVDASGYSFPSGHTLNSTVAYGLIALVVWRSTLPITARRVAVVALAALIVLIGASRIALGVHYPSDVLAGLLAGTAIVAGAAALVPQRPTDPPVTGRSAAP
jgi:undecaprenyl-diphosphatase